jgi:cytochrome c553
VTVSVSQSPHPPTHPSLAILKVHRLETQLADYKRKQEAAVAELQAQVNAHKSKLSDEHAQRAEGHRNEV